MLMLLICLVIGVLLIAIAAIVSSMIDHYKVNEKEIDKSDPVLSYFLNALNQRDTYLCPCHFLLKIFKRDEILYKAVKRINTVEEFKSFLQSYTNILRSYGFALKIINVYGSPFISIKHISDKEISCEKCKDFKYSQISDIQNSQTSDILNNLDSQSQSI